MTLISLSTYFNSGCYCLGSFVKKVSKAWGQRVLGPQLPIKPWQSVLLREVGTEPDTMMDVGRTASQWNRSQVWVKVLGSEIFIHGLYLSYIYTHHIYYIHTHIGTQHIFAQRCCNFSHIFGQNTFENSDFFFFLRYLFSLILFLFWWHHSPKIWKSSICIRQAFSK